MISEEFLKKAAEEAAQVMAENIPENAAHSFSPAFEEKMQKLQAKKNGRTAHTLLRYAACAVLALLLLGGALMLNQEVRASVVGWISEESRGFIRYFLKETDIEEHPVGQYELTWMPDGYCLKQRHVTKNYRSGMVIYRNTEGKLISLIYTNGVYSELFVSEEGCTKKEITVSGKQAVAYISYDTENNSTIVWENSGVLFAVSAVCDIDVLTQIAEGVIEK